MLPVFKDEEDAREFGTGASHYIKYHLELRILDNILEGRYFWRCSSYANSAHFAQLVTLDEIALAA